MENKFTHTSQMGLRTRNVGHAREECVQSNSIAHLRRGKHKYFHTYTLSPSCPWRITRLRRTPLKKRKESKKVQTRGLGGGPIAKGVHIHAPAGGHTHAHTSFYETCPFRNNTATADSQRRRKKIPSTCGTKKMRPRFGQHFFSPPERGGFPKKRSRFPRSKFGPSGSFLPANKPNPADLENTRDAPGFPLSRKKRKKSACLRE